jgi:hypothetical protein
MKVVCISMFHRDAGKHLADRLTHLYAKQGVSRFIHKVKPGPDCTPAIIESVSARLGAQIDMIWEDEPDYGDRLATLSAAGDVALSAVRPDDDLVLWHESDLFSDDDIVARLHEAAPGAAAVGAWPWLSHCPGRMELGLPGRQRTLLPEPLFYDTWGYRKDGVRFGNRPPHHECYTADQPFRLDSVGSVVLIDAAYIRRGARMHGNGLVGLCADIRRMGGEVWCDPRVPVVQPTELWVFNDN